MPTTVVITPVATVTLRMRLLARSEMYKLPELSNTTSCGLLSLAAVACMLSPLYPVPPFPATVDIIPVDTVTLRITLFAR